MGLNGKAIVLALAFMAGAGAGYITKPIPAPIPLVVAKPIDVVAIRHMQKYNPLLTEADALYLLRHIELTIDRYHADPHYAKGATNQITPRLIVALISVESSFRWSAISDHGAIGLCQVMPLHLDDLERAGIGTDLLDAENNIEAGIHILMGYAKGVDSITRALSRYNGGYKREKAGRGYAKKVLALYAQMR